jgi:hypothetical protein
MENIKGIDYPKEDLEAYNDLLKNTNPIKGN